MSRPTALWVGLVGILLVQGIAPPAALAQPAEAHAALVTEVYRVLRDEALAQPTPETLIRGGEAGLRQLARDAVPAGLSPLPLTGDERTDLQALIGLVEQVAAATGARPLAVAYAATAGMVAALRDANSVFYTPEQFSAFIRRTLPGDFVGIGVVLEDRGGQPVVTEVLENSPAGEAGVRPGDVILAVDGTPTAGMTLDQVSQLIRGAEGAPVVLRVQRAGQPAPLELSIVRRRIQTRSVSWRLLPSGVGYIRITQFTQGADGQVAEALRSLIEQGVRGVILDMRGNPGGLLDVSVNIASHFLERGVVVTLESGRGATSYMVRPRAPKYTGPLVVLVDRGSASASEVVAGALQDAGIKVVGSRTYGKATVQAIYRFTDGSGLRVTISRYLTPSGRDLEGRGLDPDVEVSTAGAPIGSPDDAPLNRAVAMLQQAAQRMPAVAP